MNVVEQIYKYFKQPLVSNIFSGAIDVIAVKQKNGEIQATPFHIRFGCLQSWKSETKVDVMVNGQWVDIHMQTGEQGEAVFLHPPAPPSLRLTSQQLAQLPLMPGRNVLRFQVQGHVEYIQNALYFYNYDQKFFISDIDGTITKQDQVGMLLGMLNIDFTHANIAACYQKLHSLNIQVLYLTARPVEQYQMTLNNLHAIHQQGHSMPTGPLFMSPDLTKLQIKRELHANNYILKTNILQNIQALFNDAKKDPKQKHFQPNENPFILAFGNQSSDCIAYRMVDIPLENIYAINRYSQIIQISNPKVLTNFQDLVGNIKLQRLY